MSSSNASPPSSHSHVQIPFPHCHGMSEHPSAASERAQLSSLTNKNPSSTPLTTHLIHGLAYTTGSALGSTPPTIEQCLAAFVTPNKAGLTAGARAWSKHGHRSRPQMPEHIAGRDRECECELEQDLEQMMERSKGWWGTPSGPVAIINEAALGLFWKVMKGATWRNLHWLPHEVLVYEVRVGEGYGMRWAKDGAQQPLSPTLPREGQQEERAWALRGFVEPMMKNGHEVGWRH
jgi:hypothetical protein